MHYILGASGKGKVFLSNVCPNLSMLVRVRVMILLYLQMYSPLTIIQGHHIRQGAVIRHAQICRQKGHVLKMYIKPTECSGVRCAVCPQEGSSVLTFVFAVGDADAWRVAFTLDPLLEHGFLQILHLLLLPLALLQSTLLLWFAELALQGQFAGRLINLPLNSQVSFQHLQL